MIRFADAIYPKLPVLLQNFACSLYGAREARVRFNKTFARWIDFLCQSEHWQPGEIENYQNEQLRAVVRHAYRHVPYYRQRMDALKLTPPDVSTREDLHKLPVLTKEDVRHHAAALLAEDAADHRLVQMKTSGTTGKSLHFYVTRESIAFRWAIWWRHRLRFGVTPGEWHANFTGKLVVPPEQSRPPYWRVNLPARQLLLCMQHMTPDKIRAIAQFLDGKALTYYSGYPSIIHAFAQCLIDSDVQLRSPPRFIFTGAENTLDFQRTAIQRVTGAVLSDQYGFAEGCGNASHCTALRYHEDFEYGILECVDGSTPDADGRVRGRILATGFASPAFPFIRYEIGDVGIWEDAKETCACGRRSRVLLGIEGRADDYVVTPEGRRIMRFDYIFKDTHHVRESQIVQHTSAGITVRIVRRPEYSLDDEHAIRKDIAKWISPRLDVRFEYLAEIPREQNGKFRAVKSALHGGT